MSKYNSKHFTKLIKCKKFKKYICFKILKNKNKNKKREKKIDTSLQKKKKRKD